MTALLSQLAELLNSAVFVLLVILVAVMWGVHKITAITTKWAHRDSEITGLREDWNRDIPALRARVDLIYQGVFPEKAAVATRSPARLTGVGQDIAEALKAEDIVAQNVKELDRLIKQDKPDTVYDLQQACFSVVEKHLPKMLSTAQMRTAKDKALEHGIPLDIVLSVVAVLLRDMLIREQGWHSASTESEDK